MKERADAKEVMVKITDIYKAELARIKDYWKESAEKNVIENGRERIIAAEPPEKRLDTVREMKQEAYAKVQAAKNAWLDAEHEFFALHGEQITPDMGLLNDVVNPTVEQLQELAERYFHKNAVMEQAIINFAEKNKEKYRIVFAMPRTQTTAERLDVIEVFDKSMMKPRFEDSANRPESNIGAFDFMNCYKAILNQWLLKIV